MVRDRPVSGSAGKYRASARRDGTRTAAAASSTRPPVMPFAGLGAAESLVARSRLLSDHLFREAQRMVEYRRMLATRERCAQFEEKLRAQAQMINRRLDNPLPTSVVDEVADRLASTIAAWEHSPIRQRERQRKQAASRRRRNRGRDLQIVRLHESGESLASIAARFGMSRSGVRKVLLRDLPCHDKAAESDTTAVG